MFFANPFREYIIEEYKLRLQRVVCQTRHTQSSEAKQSVAYHTTCKPCLLPFGKKREKEKGEGLGDAQQILLISSSFPHHHQPHFIISPPPHLPPPLSSTRFM